jgi:hypothetical protein
MSKAEEWSLDARGWGKYRGCACSRRSGFLADRCCSMLDKATDSSTRKAEWRRLLPAFSAGTKDDWMWEDEGAGNDETVAARNRGREGSQGRGQKVKKSLDARSW